MMMLRSRSRVALLALVVFLVLDLARSMVARSGYAQPTEHWQPDPRAYSDLAWPPGSGLPADAGLGMRVYAKHCAVCHGPDGRGNGPAAPSLVPRPADFTLGQFKYAASSAASSAAGSAGQAPSDEDLVRIVTNGLAASAMPYWRDVLSEDEIRAVVQTVKSFADGSRAHVSRAGVSSSAMPPPGAQAGVMRMAAPLPVRPAPTAAGIARGRTSYELRGCVNCHGADGRGDMEFADANGHTVISRDLSAPWTFRGGSGAEQIWLRITNGMAPGPMPALPAEVSAQERWDIVDYVISLARTPPWEPGGRFGGPGTSADPERRGRYLVHAQICGLCHTQIDASGIYRADDSYLAGGMRVGAYPHASLVSRNITSDPATGVGSWSEAQIVAALREGRSGGRVLTVMDMPWAYFHALTDDDATGIARYLKVLSPVHNRIPAPLHYGLIETLVSKLSRPLPQVPTTFLTYADQGFGYRDDAALPAVAPAAVLVALVLAQWLVAGLGVVGFVLATPRGSRLPRRLGGRLALAAGCVVVVFVGALLAMVYALPQLTIIPPGQIAAAATAGIPSVDPAVLGSPERIAMAERGRYLFTVASCALCHRNDGRGGAKVSWKPMGTVWSANLTPDPQAGVGLWTDAQIARAIRSGVARDGRPLHWQAMPWDHASNWDEEDVRALIAYLRSLPPVRQAVPSPRAPAGDDCETYTFWTTDGSEPGCMR
jgi:mono/diheme cytochrome c family protein